MMRWLPVGILVAAASCAWASTGSAYRNRCTHVGVRPAADPQAYAVTLQVTTCKVP